jgi:hypothetical protein
LIHLSAHRLPRLRSLEQAEVARIVARFRESSGAIPVYSGILIQVLPIAVTASVSTFAPGTGLERLAAGIALGIAVRFLLHLLEVNVVFRWCLRDPAGDPAR